MQYQARVDGNKRNSADEGYWGWENESSGGWKATR